MFRAADWSSEYAHDSLVSVAHVGLVDVFYIRYGNTESIYDAKVRTVRTELWVCASKLHFLSWMSRMIDKIRLPVRSTRWKKRHVLSRIDH